MINGDILKATSMESAHHYLSQLLDIMILHAPGICIGIIIFVAGWITSAFTKKTIIRLSKRSKHDATAVLFLANVAYVGIMLVITLTALSQMGIPITPISSMLAGILVGISMSLKSSVGNLSSGIVIALFRPFRIGEFIDIGSGTSGTVEAIDLFFSKLRTTDGREVTVPNNLIMSRAVENYSNNEFRRNDYIIGISYDDNIQKAKDILQKLIDSDDRILKEVEGKTPLIRVNELGSSSVNLVVRYWTKRSDFLETKWALIEQSKLAFDEADITIPYPQQDVYLHRND